jgi:hypothetical protein
MSSVVRLVSACSAIFVGLLCLSGCSHPELKTVPASFTVELKDPLFRRVSEATESFHVKASGIFNEGTFTIKGIPLKCEPGTTFTLDLNLPIEEPGKINTGVASGKLVTSKPLILSAVPMPQTILLENGQATANIDLVKALGYFLFNALQYQSVDANGGGDFRKIIKTMVAQEAIINLRPDAKFDLGRLHINCDKDSRVVFTNVKLKDDLSYEGQCLLDIKFAKGCKYEGKKVDIEFNDGDTDFVLLAQRKNGVFRLSTEKNLKPLNVKGVAYRFGKTKQCNVTGDAVLAFRRFTFDKSEGAEHGEVHALADLDLLQAKLYLKNPKMVLTAAFKKDVNSKLQIDTREAGREYLWSTAKAYPAATMELHINRPNSHVEVLTTDVNVGPVSLDKQGDLGFFMDNGVAQLHQISWSNGKRNFKLLTAQGSTLSIPDGKDFNLNKDSAGMHFSLPLSIKAGSAELIGAKTKLHLSNVKGNVNVVVDKEIELNSDLSLTLDKCAILANNPIDVKVGAIDLSSKSGKSLARFKTCSITVPDAALLATIAAQLPQNKEYKMNKIVLKNQKWRYRDAVINKLIIKKLAIDKVQWSNPNEESFSGNCDVEVDGTVEKGGMLSVIKKTKKWEECPWSATGHLQGKGTVAFKFIPNKCLGDSGLTYYIGITLPPPDDVHLDWSDVSKGLLAGTERSIIVGLIKKMKPVTLNYDGKIDLFKQKRASMQTLSVENVVTRQAKDGVEIGFTADVSL